MHVRGKSIVGPGHGKCKGPVVGASLGEAQEGREAGEEIRRVMPGRKGLVYTPGEREVVARLGPPPSPRSLSLPPSPPSFV